MISLSLRNLRQAKLRTALTTLGVSIGIASLAGMVSLGVGLQEQVLGRFLQSGVFDAITVMSPSTCWARPAQSWPGAEDSRGRGGLGRKSGRLRRQKLDDEAMKQISWP